MLCLPTVQVCRLSALHRCLLYLCASAIGFAWIVIRFSLISVVGLFFGVTGTFSIASRVESAPSMTLPISVTSRDQPGSTHLPKIEYLPSNDGCFAYVMKNCKISQTI